MKAKPLSRNLLYYSLRTTCPCPSRPTLDPGRPRKDKTSRAVGVGGRRKAIGKGLEALSGSADHEAEGDRSVGVSHTGSHLPFMEDEV